MSQNVPACSAGRFRAISSIFISSGRPCANSTATIGGYAARRVAAAAPFNARRTILYWCCRIFRATGYILRRTTIRSVRFRLICVALIPCGSLEVFTAVFMASIFSDFPWWHERTPEAG